MQVQCPGCQAKLTLAKSPQPGATLQCPKCSQRFQIGTPVAEPPPAATTPVSDDIGQIPDFGGEDHSLAASLRTKSKKRTASRSKPRESKTASAGRSPGWLMPTVIGVGVLGAVAVIWIIVLMLGGGDDPQEIVATNGQSTSGDSNRRKTADPSTNIDANSRKTLDLSKDVPLPPKQGADDQRIKPQVVSRVKKATVKLRVTDSTGQQGTGTGFFAIDKNVIITNAHVVGMLAPGTEKPLSVDIVLNSGEPNERSLVGSVAAVDRTSDLAVVRFQTDSGDTTLPEPLKVFSARQLYETQRVYIFGFPLGDAVGKSITVSTSAVSSLRKNKSGLLKQVQVDGGMHPGNSGGPVTDANGSVVGIAVSGIPGTQLNFAIPGDSLYRMLDGRIAGISLGESTQQGSESFWLPITITAVDPLERLKEVQVDWWVGQPGDPRDPSTGRPITRPGDSKRETVELVYTAGTASATLTLPPVPEGKTIYIQPAYKSARGEKNWMMSINFDPGPLMEQKRLTLARKPVVGKADLHFAYNNTTRLNAFGGEESSQSSRLKATLKEQVRSVSSAAVGKRFGIDDLEWDIREDGRTSTRITEAKPSLHFVDKVALAIKEDATGVPTDQKVVMTGVGKSHTPVLEALSKQVIDSLDFLTVPIPGKEMSAGMKWESIRQFPVELPGGYATGKIRMTYAYRGVANYYRHRVAVIRVSGSIPTTVSPSYVVSGAARGNAYFDLKSQQVIVTKLNLELNILARVKSHRAKVASQTRLTLSRIPLE